MIQDIAPSVFNNQYAPLCPESNDYCIVISGKSVLLATGETISFPLYGELRQAYPHLPAARYLFAIDDRRFFLLDGVQVYPEGYEMKDIRVFREETPKELSFAGITGYSLGNWYRNHRFCGHCTGKMDHHGSERMLICPDCGNQEYPKISPAVIVGVYNGNKLLLSKYANREYSNYALLAGFAEAGEPIEGTIHREVMEEVGIKVRNIQYYKSQPWAFTDSLLLGFFAELDGDSSITLDREELAVAEWIERENIPPGNAALSLTGEMIEYFRNGGI